jgi:hypothetical protein
MSGFWHESLLPSPVRTEELVRQRRERLARAEAATAETEAKAVDPLDLYGWGAAFRAAMPTETQLAAERAAAAEERRRRRDRRARPRPAAGRRHEHLDRHPGSELARFGPAGAQPGRPGSSTMRAGKAVTDWAEVSHGRDADD